MPQQPEKPMDQSEKRDVLGPVATEFAAAATGNWRIERPRVDFARCIKCKTCERYCPTNVIEVANDDAECVHINYTYCKGCGVCTNVCPKQCIELIPEKR